MKKFSIVIFVFLIILLFLFFSSKPYSKKTQEKIVPPTKTQTQTSPTITFRTKTNPVDLFIPYWSNINESINSESFQKLIYFGVSVNEDGIDQNDQGYKNLSKFLRNADSSKEKILGVRLLDQDMNEKILNDKNIQEKVINSAIQVANDNNFNGILLDFEYSALNFDSITKQISAFGNSFASKSHSKNLKFYITAYGDTFYRARPFDASSIQKNVDGIYILAYDFHKANGNPGPNFPLNLKSDEDYDFKMMLDDFLKNIPSQKLIITFGLFGYDWTVGEKGASTKQAIPITLSQAKQKFINNCEFKNCKIIKDQSSQETEVKYTDSLGQNHDVWFETNDSVSSKKSFLFSKGITKTAVWAYSYF